MQNEKSQEQQLQNVLNIMTGIALPIGAIEMAALVHWIRKGDWKPFVGVELLAIPVAFALVRFYRDRVVYLCPHCHTSFKPEAREWFFAAHTPTTRKVTCTSCGKTDWCAEVLSD